MAEGVQGEAKLYQTLIDGCGEVWQLLKEFRFDGMSQFVDSVFIWGLSFPEERVAALWFGNRSFVSQSSSLCAAMSIL